MSTPTDVPFQDDEHAPRGSTDEGQLQGSARADEGASPTPHAAPAASEEGGAAPPESPGEALLPPSETETDLLAARVDGPEDHQGMTELWRATMALPHWWFVAVGDEGEESPAAASIQGKFMLMTFTNAERARHFAVQNGMIAATEDLKAIALSPQEVVGSAASYEGAGIDGLMFDPHLSGYFIPSSQLPIVWDAVHAQESGDQPES